MNNITKLLIIFSLLLTSCDDNKKQNYENRYKTYTVLVNYNSSYGVITPSDTIIIKSQTEPRMVIDEGVSVIKGSEWVNVYASNVRSFKILKID